MAQVTDRTCTRCDHAGADHPLARRCHVDGCRCWGYRPGRGRNRVHCSNAARQAAYRMRQARQKPGYLPDPATGKPIGSPSAQDPVRRP